MIILFVIPFVIIVLYWLFKDTLNRLQYIGPLYWITRDNGVYGDRVVTKAFMRQTAAPWKTGKGIQFRFRTYTFQIGLCRSTKLSQEDEGLLHAMQGRYLDDTVDAIRNWK
jgi:hypothetical protein